MGYRTPLALAALLVAVAAGPAAAAPGDLDPTFAGTGLVVAQFGDNTGEGDSGRGIASQPDGKTVVVGVAASAGKNSWVVARYLPDGTLDPSFGTGGTVNTVIDDGSIPQAVALQPDGKIVVAGIAAAGTNSEYAVARYLPDGSLDPSFSGDGKVGVLIDSPDNHQGARAVALAPDGKIVAAGETADGAGIVQLNGDGSPDSSFAGDGSVDIPVAQAVNGAEGVAVQSDGAVVLAVPAGAGAGDGVTLVRVDSHGTPDTSFGPGGILNVPLGDGGEATAVAIQPDGKIVAGGSAEVASGPLQFAIARFNPDGSPDMSFSGDGQELTPIAPNNHGADGRALVLQPNGKIVLAGRAQLDSLGASTLAYARYNPEDGTLDSGFGDGGKVLVPLPAGWVEDQLDAAALACDGKIVSTGFADVAPMTHGQFLTARILGDPLPCPGLNPPPAAPTPDHSKPHSKIKRIPHVIRSSRLKQFAGTAADDTGLAKVEIALLRRVGKTAAFSGSRKPKARCLWLRNGGAKFKSLKPRHGKCAAPRWLRAQGTASWLFKLKKRLPPGRYVLYSRATDTSGNAETSFSVRQGNRANFRVRKG